VEVLKAFVAALKTLVAAPKLVPTVVMVFSS